MTRIFVIVLSVIVCDFYPIKAQQEPASNCRRSDIHFDKLLGIKPSSHHQKLLLLQFNTTAQFSTKECLDRCYNNEECLSFLVDYSKNECFWYRREVHEEIREEDVEVDDGVGWFVKTCLRVLYCPNGWKFERIPGATLIGNNTRKLPDAMTRQQCQQRCLDEEEFECRSCKFKVIESAGNPSRTQGICVLSDADRHIIPNAYRVSGYTDEYFENQCIKDTTQNEFCSYEEFDNVQLSHVDTTFPNRTKLECQSLCEKNDFYTCRAYSVIQEKSKQNQQQLFQCKLHSEDSKVHGPRLLIESEGAKYYEKAPCLNITVNCTDHHMTVRFQPEVKYSGRIYMQGYSENRECYAEGAGHAPVILTIPLAPQKCGIIKAKSSLNSTLLSSIMILQYNALVQTQADRVIKVGCIFGNESKVVLGAGFNFSRENPSSGSISVNSSEAMPPPRVQLRVIDLSSQNEVSDTQIGEELQLIIELESNGPYDIAAGHLVAMTENGQDSILLLDDRGCPTNLDVFPALTRVATNTSIQLIATFQAFKFSSSNVIRFSVMVQFCIEKCPQVDCMTFNTIRKREIQVEDVANTTEVAKVSSVDPNSKLIHELPLDYVIVVRNGKLTADKFVYGENNKILVAGYDYVTNEVCLDYFLIIALIITWVLIQIIFLACGLAIVRKYKRHYKRQQLTESLEDLQKNFDYGNMSNMGIDNRRVHFLEG